MIFETSGTAVMLTGKQSHFIPNTLRFFILFLVVLFFVLVLFVVFRHLAKQSVSHPAINRNSNRSAHAEWYAQFMMRVSVLTADGANTDA
jgi:quinol-cytochrome oxidoreductase complex cytochrome b subunit